MKRKKVLLLSMMILCVKAAQNPKYFTEHSLFAEHSLSEKLTKEDVQHYLKKCFFEKRYSIPKKSRKRLGKILGGNKDKKAYVRDEACKCMYKLLGGKPERRGAQGGYVKRMGLGNFIRLQGASSQELYRMHKNATKNSGWTSWVWPTKITEKNTDKELLKSLEEKGLVKNGHLSPRVKEFLFYKYGEEDLLDLLETEDGKKRLGSTVFENLKSWHWTCHR